VTDECEFLRTKSATCHNVTSAAPGVEYTHSQRRAIRREFEVAQRSTSIDGEMDKNWSTFVVRPVWSNTPHNTDQCFNRGGAEIR